jgi:hypothetical protein
MKETQKKFRLYQHYRSVHRLFEKTNRNVHELGRGVQ